MRKPVEPKAETAKLKDAYFQTEVFCYDDAKFDCYIRIDRQGVFSKDQADQTADLIRWVLDNQDKVIKIKNK
jgi:hypothetical protein